MARVDTVAVRAMAQEFTTTAAIIAEAARKHMAHFDFGGAAAGRAYAGRGDALRDALFEVASSLREWSRAAAEIAAALNVSADRYEDADAVAASRLG
ncbi:type VII secretion target [Mycolicibacterium sp. BiH015]|uniref:type VII secretion target n=1 Tax=Mycolicibacterium sp. BiH015 TaxID=3018808 RepID=UPI0022DEA6B8|nr:type VII secretion target [Mycolicibacterium sp. BiH015]MDA2894760.1 type VII secretion target [Mycolicibacterium sp. BiH015]